MRPKGKTVRFSEVVETCGRPEPMHLWVDPRRDRLFRAALHAERVMTITQSGSKSDSGKIGFKRGTNVSYLVFPKPLTPFRDRRVIGIKYNLLATPKPAGQIVEPGSPTQRWFYRSEFSAPRGQRLSREAQEQLQRKLYRVTVRFTAMVYEDITIEAEDRRSAREKALDQVSKPDLTQATIIRTVRRVSEL